MSLSAKFASLSGPAVAKNGGKKKLSGGIVLKKIGSPKPNNLNKNKLAIQAQKGKRQSQIQMKRGIASPGGKIKSPIGRGKSPIGRGKNVQGGKGGGKPNTGKNGKGPKGKNGKKIEKKKPVTAQELDKDIDTYWFKAGKGPNPDIVELDKEMDEYMKAKTAAAAATNA
jgi:hypothetical protein